jgi:hypothetical protein
MKELTEDLVIEAIQLSASWSADSEYLSKIKNNIELLRQIAPGQELIKAGQLDRSHIGRKIRFGVFEGVLNDVPPQGSKSEEPDVDDFRHMRKTWVVINSKLTGLERDTILLVESA